MEKILHCSVEGSMPVILCIRWHTGHREVTGLWHLGEAERKESCSADPVGT